MKKFFNLPFINKAQKETKSLDKNTDDTNINENDLKNLDDINNDTSENINNLQNSNSNDIETLDNTKNKNRTISYIIDEETLDDSAPSLDNSEIVSTPTYRGISTKNATFIELKERKAYYADKTHFIEYLENSCSSNHVINRPKGCGKTTTISMMKAFYDVALAHSYDFLFEDLYIYKKTLEHNNYCILEFDFANITSGKNIIEPVFYSLDSFAAKYNIDFQVDFKLSIKSNIAHLMNAYIRSNREEPIYVLIDNYNDFHLYKHFSETDENPFTQIFLSHQKETEDFYEALLRAKNQGVITRIFAAGIMPNYNTNLISDYFKDITFSPSCTTAIGFTEKEVASLLKSHQHLPKTISYDQLLDNVINYYDGYCFSVAINTISVINARELLKYVSSSIGIISPSFSTQNHHTLYLLLQELYTYYSKILNTIDDELTRTGKITATPISKTPKQHNKDSMIWYLFYIGVLTMKEVVISKTENTAPLINFRISNISILELWKNIIIDKS